MTEKKKKSAGTGRSLDPAFCESILQAPHTNQKHVKGIMAGDCWQERLWLDDRRFTVTWKNITGGFSFCATQLSSSLRDRIMSGECGGEKRERNIEKVW